VAYVSLIELERLLPVEPRLGALVRVGICAALLLVYSRPVLDLWPRRAVASVFLGALVFAVWIGPDLLWPSYRGHWLFFNAILGAPRSTLPLAAHVDRVFLCLRVVSSVIVVPIVEELFWRAWLMRRLISADFRETPLGRFTSQSFWLTAVFFALEHGSYWDVGLLAGIAYNLWIVRTKSLADCILAHAVTNGLLAVYVIAAGKWDYWL
jgi:CAAX prenyl protease-like protein